MKLKGIKIGIALTGSHCTIDTVVEQIKYIVQEGGEVYTIISPAVDDTDTRFGEAAILKKKLLQITNNKIINTIAGAEPIGPQSFLDIIVIAPCSGNTMAKLANGITDTPVLMAAKAQLRNEKPVLLGISTNDGLGINAKNLGVILNSKNIFVVPFRQDNPMKKPNSIISCMDLLIPSIIAVLEKKQLQPILLGNKQ